MGKGGKVERQRKTEETDNVRVCVCVGKKVSCSWAGRRLKLQHKSPCSRVYPEKPNRTRQESDRISSSMRSLTHAHLHTGPHTDTHTYAHFPKFCAQSDISLGYISNVWAGFTWWDFWGN